MLKTEKRPREETLEKNRANIRGVRLGNAIVG